MTEIYEEDRGLAAILSGGLGQPTRSGPNRMLSMRRAATETLHISRIESRKLRTRLFKL